MKPHPLGVQPLGQMLFQKTENSRHAGLGSLRCIPDEILLQIFDELDSRSLCSLARAPAGDPPPNNKTSHCALCSSLIRTFTHAHARTPQTGSVLQGPDVLCDVRRNVEAESSGDFRRQIQLRWDLEGHLQARRATAVCCYHPAAIARHLLRPWRYAESAPCRSLSGRSVKSSLGAPLS